ATDHDIWVLCDGNRKYINGMNGTFQTIISKANFNYDTDVYYTANSVGFTKIQSGDFLPFEIHHNRIIYITIKGSANSSCRLICDCFPVRHDEPVIVSSGGYVHKTNYGNLWLDLQGRYHAPPRKVTTEQPMGESEVSNCEEGCELGKGGTVSR
ncbi:hypothetical protein PENTCL1PPCAC_23673, partial [Pristionchus entomophagus]